MSDGDHFETRVPDRILSYFLRPDVFLVLREALEAEAHQDRITAQAAYSRLQAIAPELSMPRTRLQAQQDPDRCHVWRRWTFGEASLSQSANVQPDAPMAVVVISFRCQEGLAPAVRALLEQAIPLEIIVVNSGGGDPFHCLAFARERIRIIDVREPLNVGAARNIGIDGSTAPLVAFLAADCRPRPGWIAARLAAHDRGARAVACAMVPHSQAIFALTEFLCLFGARAPEVPPLQAQRFGASYSRDIFREFGYFLPGLRTGEDSEFARRISKVVHPRWVPEARTEHHGPSGPIAFFVEMFLRGRRAAVLKNARLPKSYPALAFSSFRTALLRTRAAWMIGRNMLKWPIGRLARLALPLALANIFYAAGIGHAVMRLKRAG